MSHYYEKNHLVLNIGLLRSDNKQLLNPLFVEQYLAHIGLDVREFKLFVSKTEPTAVVVLRVEQWMPGAETPMQYTLASRISKEVAAFLKQEAIALYVPCYDVGILVGPKAEAWGDFNAEFFLMPDGRRLSEHKNSTQNQHA